MGLNETSHEIDDMPGGHETVRWVNFQLRSEEFLRGSIMTCVEFALEPAEAGKSILSWAEAHESHPQRVFYHRISYLCARGAFFFVPSTHLLLFSVKFRSHFGLSSCPPPRSPFVSFFVGSWLWCRPPELSLGSAAPAAPPDPHLFQESEGSEVPREHSRNVSFAHIIELPSC